MPDIKEFNARKKVAELYDRAWSQAQGGFDYMDLLRRAADIKELLGDEDSPFDEGFNLRENGFIYDRYFRNRDEPFEPETVTVLTKDIEGVVYDADANTKKVIINLSSSFGSKEDGKNAKLYVSPDVMPEGLRDRLFNMSRDDAINGQQFFDLKLDRANYKTDDVSKWDEDRLKFLDHYDISVLVDGNNRNFVTCEELINSFEESKRLYFEQGFNLGEQTAEKENLKTQKDFEKQAEANRTPRYGDKIGDYTINELVPGVKQFGTNNMFVTAYNHDAEPDKKWITCTYDIERGRYITKRPHGEKMFAQKDMLERAINDSGSKWTTLADEVYLIEDKRDRGFDVTTNEDNLYNRIQDFWTEHDVKEPRLENNMLSELKIMFNTDEMAVSQDKTLSNEQHDVYFARGGSNASRIARINVEHDTGKIASVVRATISSANESRYREFEKQYVGKKFSDVVLPQDMLYTKEWAEDEARLSKGQLKNWLDKTYPSKEHISDDLDKEWYSKGDVHDLLGIELAKNTDGMLDRESFAGINDVFDMYEAQNELTIKREKERTEDFEPVIHLVPISAIDINSISEKSIGIKMEPRELEPNISYEENEAKGDYILHISPEKVKGLPILPSGSFDTELIHQYACEDSEHKTGLFQVMLDQREYHAIPEIWSPEYEKDDWITIADSYASETYFTQKELVSGFNDKMLGYTHEKGIQITDGNSYAEYFLKKNISDAAEGFKRIDLNNRETGENEGSIIIPESDIEDVAENKDVAKVYINKYLGYDIMLPLSSETFDADYNRHASGIEFRNIVRNAEQGLSVTVPAKNVKTIDEYTKMLVIPESLSTKPKGVFFIPADAVDDSHDKQTTRIKFDINKTYEFEWSRGVDEIGKAYPVSFTYGIIEAFDHPRVRHPQSDNRGCIRGKALSELIQKEIGIDTLYDIQNDKEIESAKSADTEQKKAPSKRVYLNRVPEDNLKKFNFAETKILIPDKDSVTGFGNIVVENSRVFLATKKGTKEVIPGMHNVSLGRAEKPFTYETTGPDGERQHREVTASEIVDMWKSRDISAKAKGADEASLEAQNENQME